MGRAGVYGREIRLLDNTSTLLGINLGYNFYTEHENGTHELVEWINRNTETKELSLNEWNSLKGIKEMNRLKKAKNKALKIKERWRDCPYYEYMIQSNASIFKREIIIDNTPIQNQYQNFLTTNGNYTYLEIGRNYTQKTWTERFGARRKFSEQDLIYMQDYNNRSGNIGKMLNELKYGKDSTKLSKAVIPICGTWMEGGKHISILINNDILGDMNIGEQLISAVRAGNIAIVPEQPKLFKDRGCIIVNMDVAYFTARYK